MNWADIKSFVAYKLGRVDSIHISLIGMAMVVAMLMSALALPFFDLPPIKESGVIALIVGAAVASLCGLYFINISFHKRITEQATLTEVLVNNSGYAFLVFDRQGICGSAYSQTCLELLESAPAGQHIMQVLRMAMDKQSDFDEWMEILFTHNHALSFEDTIVFLPKFFPHSKRRRIKMVYRPVRDRHERLTQIVVIAMDETESYLVEQEAKRRQMMADMVVKILKEHNQFRATIVQIRQFLETADAPGLRIDDSDSLLRTLHTLKGAVRHFSMGELGDMIHWFETDLRSEDINSDSDFRMHLQDGRKKVAECLAKAMNEVRALIGQDDDWTSNKHEVEEDIVYNFARELESKNADPELIRHYLKSIVAVPLRDCFRVFEQELGDVSAMLGKQVKPLLFTGSDPRVLYKTLQSLFFSFTHICRNIADHGIEVPSERIGLGKDVAGQVTIDTEVLMEKNDRAFLKMIVRDDGAGIDPC